MNKLRSILAVLALLAAVSAVSAEEYKFTVANNTSTKITGLFAMEKGTTKWLGFNLGGGIPPGKTVPIVWGAHTNNSGCEWSIKAKYSDGSETEPSSFDFCKKTDIEFSE